MNRVEIGERVYVFAYNRLRMGRVVTYHLKNAKVVMVIPTSGKRHIATEAIRRLKPEDDEASRASVRGAPWPNDEDVARARTEVIVKAFKASDRRRAKMGLPPIPRDEVPS